MSSRSELNKNSSGHLNLRALNGKSLWFPLAILFKNFCTATSSMGQAGIPKQTRFVASQYEFRIARLLVSNVDEERKAKARKHDIAVF